MNSGSESLGSRSTSADEEFAERYGIYTRYNEILGKGAFKTVYKAFDEANGIEVAWNQVDIEDVKQTSGQHTSDQRTSDQLRRLHAEVQLLSQLKHENIIKLYHSWVDDKKQTINMITELFTSGSLRAYRRKHKNVDIKAIKSWARQILKGLHYLHSQNPPVIHRDLKCDNVFVNGNTGEVKIGDLGLAAVMHQPVARSVIGTPEFMAPELYDEEYNELVDIYSFGMCMLEMVTCEYPYSECKNQAQIYKKVIMGRKPMSLDKVSDEQVKQFIEKCLLPASMRLPALELLKDPFLALDAPKETFPDISQLSAIMPETIKLPNSGPLAMDMYPNNKNLSNCSSVKSSHESPQHPTLILQRFAENKEFSLSGETIDDTTVAMHLRIADQSGKARGEVREEVRGEAREEAKGEARTIDFDFYLESDTAIAIVREMIVHLGLSNEDVIFIAELIDELILKLVPNRSSSFFETTSNEPNSFYTSIQNSTCTMGDKNIKAKLTVMKDQETQQFLGSEISDEYYFTGTSSSSVSQPMGYSEYSFKEYDKGSSSVTLDPDMGVHECGDASGETKQNRTVSNSDYPKNSHSQISCLDSYSVMSKDMSLSGICTMYITDKDQTDELSLELNSIESQFQHCFQELLRLREEAMENAKKKWMTKKQKFVA